MNLILVVIAGVVILISAVAAVPFFNRQKAATISRPTGTPINNVTPQTQAQTEQTAGGSFESTLMINKAIFAVGEELRVDVNIDTTPDNEITFVDLKMQFDNNLLEAVKFQSSNLLDRQIETKSDKMINNDNGTIRIVLAASESQKTFPKGKFSAGTLSFKAKMPGMAKLSFLPSTEVVKRGNGNIYNHNLSKDKTYQIK